MQSGLGAVRLPCLQYSTALQLAAPLGRRQGGDGAESGAAVRRGAAALHISTVCIHIFPLIALKADWATTLSTNLVRRVQRSQNETRRTVTAVV